MISISVEGRLITVSVLGEFTLADFREFEQHILYGVRFQGQVDLLIDLRDMLGYTVDVVWEEIKFSRSHEREFGRVAVVTSDQWITWSAWLQRLLIDADIRVFADFDAAMAWVSGAD